MRNLAQQIYKVLIRRRYNRGEPFLLPNLEKIIVQSVEQNRPIPLVGFWGIGPKTDQNWADVASCAFLQKLHEDVKKIYTPGINFVFIFASSHALHNGYSPEIFKKYISGMITLFKGYGFRYVFLDDLWKKYNISFEKIQKIFAEKPDAWWEDIDNRETMERNVRQRNTQLPAHVCAQKYFIMRDLEKTMLEQEFDGYIFHAFSDPELKNVLPHMPTLYFYAREGWSNAPWFVTHEKE